MIKTGDENFRQCRETPKWFIRYLENYLFGRSFDIDMAASSDNRVCWHFYDIDTSSLAYENWEVFGDQLLWCNPPFKHKMIWIKRFATAKHCALLLPNAPWEKWWIQSAKVSSMVLNHTGRIHYKLPAWAPQKALNRDSSPNSGMSVFIRGFYYEPYNTIFRQGNIVTVDGSEISRV